MQNTVKVWDLPLRVFHWLLVVSFFTAYITEEDLLNLHVWAGYAVLGLLVFRLIWGFLGNEYARFSHFLCRPKQSMQYVKDLVGSNAKRYLGHNPAGAAMIVLLLLALLLTTITGLAVLGADQNTGFLSFIGSTNEKQWEELHELSANFTVLLVFIHIVGVAIESYIHQENLVKSMFHGNKKITEVSHEKSKF